MPASWSRTAPKLSLLCGHQAQCNAMQLVYVDSVADSTCGHSAGDMSPFWQHIPTASSPPCAPAGAPTALIEQYAKLRNATRSRKLGAFTFLAVRFQTNVPVSPIDLLDECTCQSYQHLQSRGHIALYCRPEGGGSSRATSALTNTGRQCPVRSSQMTVKAAQIHATFINCSSQ
jgi:hypothetical protein